MDKLNIRELFGDEVYSKALADALAEGWLADVDYHIVFDDAVKEAIESGFETDSLRALAELFDVQARNEVIAKNINQEMERIGLKNAKTIVFCQNIEHAEEMAKLLGGKTYHSQSGNNKDRSATLAEFRSGGLQVICTRDMFNEGVDIPDARLLVFLRSTSSQTIFEQQLGRGLRKQEGKDRVSVLDFVANVERIALIQELMQKVESASSNTGKEQGAWDKTVVDKSSNFDERGLQIHTPHGDFDFDRLSIDLLEKFRSLAGRNDKFIDMKSDDIISLALTVSPDCPLTLSAIKDLSANRLFPSQTIILGYFGSVREFQKACGFEIRELYKLTNLEILELAQDLSPNEPLSQSSIVKLSKEKKFVSPAYIKKRFGGVANFQKACGFLPIREINISANLADASNNYLVSRANIMSPDKPLSAAAIKKLNKEGKFLSVGSIQNRFGSLTNFQTACGFEIEKPSPMTSQDIVAKALELSPDLPLNTTQIKKLSADGKFPGLTTIKRHFGNIQNFYNACGFNEVDTSRYLRNT